jgi:hypothetical protein
MDPRTGPSLVAVPLCLRTAPPSAQLSRCQAAGRVRAPRKMGVNATTLSMRYWFPSRHMFFLWAMSTLRTQLLHVRIYDHLLGGHAGEPGHLFRGSRTPGRRGLHTHRFPFGANIHMISLQAWKASDVDATSSKHFGAAKRRPLNAAGEPHG